MKPHIYLALPGYAQAHAGTIRAAFRFATKKHNHEIAEQNVSLLAHNFNTLFGRCLMARRDLPLTHFVMLHSDIEPEPWWLDRLVEEIERSDADVLSCVVPIKTDSGITSTGVGHIDEPWTADFRLTIRQVQELPETFGIADLGISDPKRCLLVNTGCWIARLDRPWLDEFPGFTIRDRLVRLDDGTVRAEVEPEDWNASRWWHRHGVKVRATHCIGVAHYGDPMIYTNWGGWGEDEDSRVPGRWAELRGQMG